MIVMGFILIISWNKPNGIVGIAIRFRVHFSNVLRH